MKLSKISRQLGLLELEKEIGQTSLGLLDKGLELMIDGTDPEQIQKILLNYTICSGRQGKELLEGMLVTEGILQIQQGFYPLIIKEVLLSYLGDDMLEESKEYFENTEKSTYLMIQRYIDGLTEQNICTILEKPIAHLDNRSLQRLLRELDQETIAAAVKGSSKRIQHKVLTNVSPRLATMLINEMSCTERFISAEIESTQKSILDVINLLAEQGEIIV